VQSASEQAFPAADYEILVVNDSGGPLPVAPWQSTDRVRVVSTNRRDKSVARNMGAATARGQYLYFLDDDDWLSPGALESFRKLACTSDAVLLYAGSQLVDRRGTPLIELHHELADRCFIQLMAGEWIPTGAYIVDARAFFAVGGYDPLMPGGEDIDLCRRVALRGRTAGTRAVVVCVGMGIENSSTDYARLPAHSRRAREAILNEPGVFSEMRGSAHNSYWKGRITRAYATSVVWNLQHRRLFTAASRAAFALMSLAISGRHLLAPEFWRAVARPYKSSTFSRGFQVIGSQHRLVVG
jgi:glycosyltransferase involved in cell wall biosynthesis